MPPYLIAASAALAVLAVYLPALRSGFVVWDDDLNIVGNQHLRSMDLSLFRWAFSDISLSYWQPLNWISHALDYAVWGLNPAGHHLTNLLLHSCNVFVWSLLCMRLVEAAAGAQGAVEPHAEDRLRLLAAGGFAGLLFGLHPMNVESVAWVTGRPGMLCSLFSLLSMMSYLKYALSSGNGPRFYLLSLVCFALALMSKPSAVTLPLALLLLDWHPLGRMRRTGKFRLFFAEKAPFFALSAGAAIAALITRQTERGWSPGDESLAVRTAVAAKALAAYLWKLLLPVNLVPYYAYPRSVSVLSADYLPTVVMVFSVSVFMLFLARTRRALPAVWAWYCLTLLPVLGLIKARPVFMADRYVYLPAMGLCLLAGLAAARAWAWSASGDGRSSATRRLLPAALAALPALLCVLTLQQISVWKDSIHLWTYVIQKSPDVIVAYNNRGLALMDQGSPGAAIEDFNRAIALEPSYSRAYSNRGLAYRKTGAPDEALRDFTLAAELDPTHAEPLYNRGLVFHEMGQFGRAREDYDRAIALNPSGPAAYIDRGIVSMQLGRPDQALADFDSAIALDPTGPDAYYYRGLVRRESGQPDLAAADLQRACGLGSAAACSAVRLQ